MSLWTGLGMLVLAACFWIWLFRVPPEVPQGTVPLISTSLNLILRVRPHPIPREMGAESGPSSEKLRATFPQVLAAEDSRTSLLLRALVEGSIEPQLEVHVGRRGYFPRRSARAGKHQCKVTVRRAVCCHVGLT